MLEVKCAGGKGLIGGRERERHCWVCEFKRVSWRQTKQKHTEKKPLSNKNKETTGVVVLV